MLVNKSVFSMKEARVFAKAKGLKLKCKILLHNYICITVSAMNLQRMCHTH